MDIDDWLHRSGLGRYAGAFRANDIGLDVLPDLTDADLKELGVSLGDRRRFLKAASLLREETRKPHRRMGPDEPGKGASRPPPGAERRQLTVMFVDLVGSTALSTRLDPEDTRELIGAYHACVTAVLERLGGFVAKYLGDGVLAYFGYPQASESDAEQAVRAALEIVEAVRALDTLGGIALQVRIGIATGLVVVGDLIGRGAAEERAVVGEAPNLAARLQALAEPDTIVVAETTHRLIGNLFECLDLGTVEAKGFSVPVQAYRVLGPGAVESRFEALRTGPVPLVGRDRELHHLLETWAQVQSGAGRVALISGDAGVGKSRLLAAVQEEVRPEPHHCLRFFCAPHLRDSPLLPIVAHLERAAGFARGDAPEVRRDKLARLLAPFSLPPADTALLAELLSLSVRTGLIPELTSNRKRERTFAALLRWLEGLAEQQPVLMIFEDVHWIDPSSREFLDLAVTRTARLRLLLLVTSRPDFASPWSGQPDVMSLGLARISGPDAADLVREISGSALPHATVAEIVERTDGVPLFIEELTKAVLEAGTSNVLAAASPATPAVPATLHASLLARLDRLDPATRAAAQAGAVIGREFTRELIAASADLTEAELEAAMDRLARAELVFCRSDGQEIIYLFKHALVRDVAYGTLLRDRRRQLHAAVARALRQRFPELVEKTPEVLARHLTEAGEGTQAVQYWLEAGRRAASRSADREAVSHLRHGLDVVAGLLASPERDRIELDFQLGIGTPLIALTGWSGPEVSVAYERASALCESLGETQRLVPALFGLASNRVVRGETHTALCVAERCAVIAKRQGSPADQLLAHRARGAALMQPVNCKRPASTSRPSRGSTTRSAIEISPRSALRTHGPPGSRSWRWFSGDSAIPTRPGGLLSWAPGTRKT
ncbi:AAA family ATPase [Methylobacterium sp. WSM2598]|uniref:AAA family ATPase n=1 Tax=Methylobacterium sp. WSM2598 TaxID=398261 RepID=UPI0003A9BD0D|nr:adenylate/guanylate cyclase domain-containing protein [Methylobacterium sp. WSM2598]